MTGSWELGDPEGTQFQPEDDHSPDGVNAWVTGLAVICLVVGLVWGFFFTPDDFRQGSTVKIIYLHVPSAMMAINAWVMMLVTSLVWLIRRHHVSALAAKAAAPIARDITLQALYGGPPPLEAYPAKDRDKIELMQEQLRQMRPQAAVNGRDQA